MQKTTALVEHFQTSSKQEMTPIIERPTTKNFYENPYSNTLWATKSYNKEVIEDLSTTVSRQKTLKRMLSDHIHQQIGSQCVESLIQEEPQRKKLDSPYRLKSLDFFSNNFTSENVSCDILFIEALRDFCDAEIHYVDLLTLIKSVYLSEFQKNHKLVTEITSLAEMEGGEILLFGNIATMIDLSKLLVSHIKKRLSEIFNININSTEFWSTIKNSLTFQKFSTFEIAEILQPCFEKFRHLYDSYALYHEKQLFFLDFIKQHKNTKKLAEKWFSGCDCEYELEYLLKLPIERILGWPVFLEKLIKCGKHMLYSDSLAALSNFQYEYKLYVRSFSAKLYQHRKEEEEKELTSVKTSSILSLSSKTSSIYSSYCPSSKDEPIDMGLQEQKERFKRVYHNMEKLKTLLQKLDLLFFVKSLYGIASKWQSFVELFDKEESSSRVNSLNNNANSMHGKYIEKLERQLLAVSRLQNNEISHSLVKNLNQILGYCNKVQKVINNHHQLEKEQKRLAQKDVKYDAIMKQELYLQTALVENLPLFLQYCDSFANALTLRYCKIILSYLEIMSGGAFFLQKETESSKKGKRDLGDNFDILQLYTSNRFLTKNAVMDTCFEKDKFICSKVFRKLFN